MLNNLLAVATGPPCKLCKLMGLHSREEDTGSKGRNKHIYIHTHTQIVGSTQKKRNRVWREEEDLNPIAPFTSWVTQTTC